LELLHMESLDGAVPIFDFFGSCLGRDGFGRIPHSHRVERVAIG
jgi:hypothetical protein